jgi:DNA mismatch repair protein MutS
VDRSYGIYVAQIAGMPKPVIGRAREILAELERERGRAAPSIPMSREAEQQLELSGNHQESAVERRLQELDVMSLTPIEAISLLYELKTLVEPPGDAD